MSINPANISYDNRVPYITVAEFQNSPIASSIDFSNLVPGGTQAAQDEALQQLIYMASAEADNIVMGPLGTLCATSNTEQGRYRMNRQGFYVIHPAYWPILEVDAVAIGSVPSYQTAIPVSSDNVWIEDRQFTVLSGAFNWTSAGPLSFGAAGGSYGSTPDFITYTYDNGTELGEEDADLERKIGMDVYRAYPYHSWERGTNENWNGLVRDFFPKRTDFATITDEDVKRVERNLNHRPRKRLGFLTPHEVFVLGMVPGAVQTRM